MAQALFSNYCCGCFKTNKSLSRSTILTSRVHDVYGRVIVVYVVCWLSVRVEFGIVHVLQSKACVVCLSRLETRTKESNMYASHWELLNPKAE